MWPYSDSSSPVIGVPATPKIHIQLEDFAKSDKVLDVTLTDDIWKMIEWLSSTTDSSFTDVIRSLLFQALYGRVAFELLLAHVANQIEDEDGLDVVELSNIWISPARTEASVNVATLAAQSDIRKSVERGTPADIQHVGKANINRKLKIPQRMWSDLDRQASKTNLSPTTYVRGLLFKALQGEVNYTQWQYARTELEDGIKPPSKK